MKGRLQETVAGTELDTAEIRMFGFSLEAARTRRDLRKGQNESVQDIFTLKLFHMWSVF